jgi:hypothetical protein
MAPVTLLLALALLYWGTPLWIAGAVVVIGLMIAVVLFVTFLIVHHRALRKHKLNTTNT